MFALVDEDQLYFKVDDSNRNDYLSLDLPIFVYEKQAKAVELSYFLAPEDVLDSEDNMETWARKAIDVALRKAKK